MLFSVMTSTSTSSLENRGIYSKFAKPWEQTNKWSTSAEEPRNLVPVRAPSADEIVEEDDVGGMPEIGGNRAARLARYDNLEQLGRGGQIAEQLQLWVRGKRLRQREMPQNTENVFFGAGQRCFHARAA